MAEIDIMKIKEISLTLSKRTEGTKMREFVHSINLGKEPRIKVIRGFRGVGKTTALLQLASNPKTIYVSADHPYVENYGLYDIGKQLANAGYDQIFIDEIQYYPKWKSDTKALYDEFKNITLVVSGSAPLAFEPERRYDIIDAEPMSLKEFCVLTDLDAKESEAWRSHDETINFVASNTWITEQYSKYMQGGAFPIFFAYGEKTLGAIYHSIRKSIREDAQFFSKMDGEGIRAMERLILLLATASPGEFSANSLAKTLETSKYRIYEIVALLERMKIIRIVRPYGQGAKLVRGEPKLLFYHPNLRSAVCDVLGAQPNIGALREELAVFSFSQRGWKVRTIKGMKRNPDYIIEKGKERIIVEIGGESKGTAQFRGLGFEKLVITERQLIPLSMF